MTAEYLHVVLNHLPVLGFALAGIPLAYGLIVRHKHTVAAGLITCALCGAVTPVVMESGEEAEERLEHGAVPGAAADEGAEHWIHEHEERAEVAAVLAYLTAVAAAGGLVLLWKKPGWERVTGGVALGLVLATTGAMGWTAKAGGQIRHPEFRADASGSPASSTGGARETEEEHELDD